MKPIPQELPALCCGVVLGRLFPTTSTDHDVGSVPLLREALARPGIAHLPLAHLGVDSLAWLGLLTALETEWGVDLGNDFLIGDHVTAWSIAEALAHALSRPVPDSVEPTAGEAFSISR